MLMMKNSGENNYAWNDIIEPGNISGTIPAWEYILVFSTVLLIFFIVIKYFNLELRFKLWLLIFNLKKTEEPRAIARKTLSLFRLEKNTTYIKKKLHINKEMGDDYRLELLKACYANRVSNPQHLRILIKMTTKWL